MQIETKDFFSICSTAIEGDTTNSIRTHQFGLWRTGDTTNKNITIYYSNGTDAADSYTTDNDFLTEATWFHFVWTIDKLGKWNLFIDNISYNINVVKELIYHQHELVFLGGDIANLNGSAYPIYFDDFRIYDKALSPDEVKQIYGYTLSRQQGRISPYAYFFNGSTTDNTDNAYITKDTITDFPSTFSIAFWKKCLDKSVEGKSFVLSTASTNK